MSENTDSTPVIFHHCKKGFPGCSRADDLMVYQDMKDNQPQG